MSIEQVRNEIMRFLSSEEPEVLCITGKWGVGKTWSWKQFLKDALCKENGIALNRYAYISLFGINSLNELKYSIFENTVNKDQVGNDANLETFKSALKSAEVLGRKSAWVLNLIPGLKSSFGAAAPAFFLMVRSQIICIDDLERKGRNLEVGDVLGLISFLREQRRCKISLILNDDALPEGQKEDFHKYLEKVADVSLKFEPSAEDSIKIALMDKTNNNAQIAENCKKLDIKNIRIIKKIENLVGKITTLLRGYDEELNRQAIKSLTLLSWSVYASDTAVPKLDYLQAKSKYDNLDLSKEKTISKEEGAWNALLDAYGFYSMDEFDNLLLNGVQNGFFDSEAIKKIALELNNQIKARKSTESFWKAWETYRDSFADNQEEVIDIIYKSFYDNLQYISPIDLNGTVWLFKQLGKPEKAADIIKYYIENRQGDRRFFDLDNWYISRVDDPDVINAFKTKSASFKEDTDANDLMSKMAESRGWSNEEMIMVSELTEDDYYQIFTSQKGEKLKSIISFCLQSDKISNPSDEMMKISEKARNALRRIGKESTINALRVSNYVGKIDNSA